MNSKEKFVEFLSTLELVHGDCGKNSLDKFETFSKIIHQYNNKFGLISNNDLENIWVRHFQDSLMPLKLFPHLFKVSKTDTSKVLKILDLGSGAGFPGVPLALLNPSMEFTLVEPNKRRAFFLDQILVRSLGLKNIEVINERIDYTVKQIIDIKSNIVVSRAVSELEELLKLYFPLIEGGHALFWISNSVKNDIDRIKLNALERGREFLDFKEYQLDSEDMHGKALILFKNRLNPNFALGARTETNKAETFSTKKVRA